MMGSWANRVTVARMVLIPVFLGVLLARMPNWGPWLAAAVFGLLAASDGLDGYLARSRGEVTTFGKLIDPLADKLLVTAALVALVELGQLSTWIAMIIISREFIVTGLRMVAVAEGKVMVASKWGKLKTVLQIVAIIAFIVKDSQLLATLVSERFALVFAWLAWGLMGLALAATIISMADYFYEARELLTGPWRAEA
jgi:CDP-diacylglycerol--glycerol-3-phosphate 3-phosphatidyltransferase